MSATERLRELLDERWVEHEVDDAKTVRVTRWRAYGDWVSFIEYDNGDTKFCIDARRLTPEQAIAATQRGGYQGFWTHDGTLHIELPKLPESISVRLPDKRDSEVRSAKVWQYTLSDSDATRERQGVGTCHVSVQEVYLVEVSDELLESWFPFAVFLHRESAEDYAEALRGKDDGVLCFARVSELKVMDE